VLFSLSLSFMIACMHLLHAVIHVCKLDKDETSGTTVKSASAPAAASAAPAQDDAAVAAIAAAVHEQAIIRSHTYNVQESTAYRTGSARCNTSHSMRHA
jgi:Na+-transporting methylmalonyl-CoA/oxaloacetate decarboxylase gamma subunit